MSKDIIFEGQAASFQQHIYNNLKGEIRLEMIKDDLQNCLPTGRALNVLDLGGGLGQMSLWLAQQGHNVTFCEPASDLFDAAIKHFTQAGLADRIDCKMLTLQDFSLQNQKKYDLILLHAVLEWLARPQKALKLLPAMLADSGLASLLYYNRNAAIMRSLLVGDFKRVEQGHIAATHRQSKQKHFAPISPLEPGQINSWVTAQGFRIKSWTGIRCIHDFMYPMARKQVDKDALLQMERRFSHIEPWRSLARYQHLIMSLASC